MTEFFSGACTPSKFVFNSNGNIFSLGFLNISTTKIWIQLFFDFLFLFSSFLLPSFSFLFFLYLFCLFAFPRAAPKAYGGSQARGGIRAVAADLCHSHSNARSKPESATYTVAQGNARSLTCLARPMIKLTSLQRLAKFLT